MFFAVNEPDFCLVCVQDGAAKILSGSHGSRARPLQQQQQQRGHSATRLNAANSHTHNKYRSVVLSTGVCCVHVLAVVIIELL